MGPPPASPRLAFEKACAAIGTPEFPPLLTDAIKVGVHAHHHFDAGPLTTEEIAERVRDPEAIELLRRLDRMRFSRGLENAETLLASVRRYLDL